MMAELTWHTGCSGDELTIHVSWFDENNVRQTDVVALQIENQDKPRTLAVSVNGAEMARIRRHD